jgi:myo-inositol-1-phosphate synthase
MRALGDLGATIPDRRIRELLAERGRRVVEGVSNELGEQDVKDLRIRLAALEQAALEA